jgi:IS1 family transposase
MPNSQLHCRPALRKRQAEMNVLPIEKQIRIISALVEGTSVRATARMCDVEHKTVIRGLLRVGDRCANLLNMTMRRLPCKIVQVDEIWTYVAKKEKRVRASDNPVEVGDRYVFVATDSERKLVPCFRIGKRNASNAWYFMQELESRLANRVQLTTDGFRPYVNAVDNALGTNVDYAMLVKKRLISTSHIKRQNLTIRMQLRRLTRLTNAFSKKLESLKAACALHFARCNFCRIHSTLRVTPVKAASIEGQIWNVDRLIIQ